MTKSILCFHLGYTQDPNNDENKNTSLIELFELLSLHYNIFIFGTNIFKESLINNVQYYNSTKIDDFISNNNIETFILLKYIYPFLDFEIKAKKVFLWVPDLFILPYYENIEIPDNGKYLLKNLIDNINIITTTQHRENLSNFYEIDFNKILIIDNNEQWCELLKKKQ